jgi:3-phosphoshikimate 1-carboxyvinyltransferase
MNAQILPPSGKISATVTLPASKSISNRVLLIRALCKKEFQINNLSAAADTIQLDSLLRDDNSFVDARDGGTTLRFLIAYYALLGEEKIITASDSLKLRPVSQLVDALQSLGAAIEYTEEAGKLPVKVSGGKLASNFVTINGEISSQFISALMMIGPYIKGGLTITITGEILSLPYILMTQSIMEYFNTYVDISANVITIAEGAYTEKEFTVEADWSAASYWYEIAALSDEADITLIGLQKESLQGDAVIAAMMEQFGVTTTFRSDGVHLNKKIEPARIGYFTADFSGCPDLAPAVIGIEY